MITNHQPPFTSALPKEYISLIGLSHSQVPTQIGTQFHCTEREISLRYFLVYLCTWKMTIPGHSFLVSGDATMRMLVTTLAVATATLIGSTATATADQKQSAQNSATTKAALSSAAQAATSTARFGAFSANTEARHDAVRNAGNTTVHQAINELAIAATPAAATKNTASKTSPENRARTAPTFSAAAEITAIRRTAKSLNLSN